jgi:kynurenine formamidase
MPQHFIAEGKVLEDYPPDFWIFNNVSIVELNNIQTGSVIAPESFERCCLSSSTDLLLIKTGFGSLRNKPAYCLENPIFLPELADFLRSKMPSLRAIGFDAISLSSWTDRLTGRTAHRAFLKGEKPILLIEDMRLSQINGSTPITRVTVAPLLVEGADASPCTIIAEVKN